MKVALHRMRPMKCKLFQAVVSMMVFFFAGLSRNKKCFGEEGGIRKCCPKEPSYIFIPSVLNDTGSWNEVEMVASCTVTIFHNALRHPVCVPVSRLPSPTPGRI